MKTNGIYILLISLMLISCKGSDKTSVDFSQEVYSPKYAKGFNISGIQDSPNTLISIHNPWQGAEDVETSLLICRDGNVPEGFVGQVVPGNAKRIVCMSSSHVAMLDALDDFNRIVGVSGIPYVSNPKLAASSQTVLDVGYEGNADYEAMAMVRPDLVLLYGVNGASSMEGKLKELGIPFIYIGDYLEEDPLGKAEWLVAIAEIVGDRTRGEEIFNEIQGRYETLKKKVIEADLPAPKVMINLPFADAWFMPSTQSYTARLIKDAGGKYVYTKNTGNVSQPIDYEEALVLASKADIWLDPGSISSLDEFRQLYPKFSDLPPVKNGKLYNNNLRMTPGGGNDIYESGIIFPDLILRDMIKIFHPSLIDEDFVYYRVLQ